jgi:hypothetical protein
MPASLIKKCVQASSGGADFPTIWHTLLKPHPLVSGIPHQRLHGLRSVLAIPLITGQALVYDGERKAFSLE